VILGSGSRPDGAPRVIVGLDHDEAVRLLAGDPLVIESEHINPLLPPLQIVLMAGASNDDMLGVLRRHWPEVWEVPDA
jgi:hypothetical protein